MYTLLSIALLALTLAIASAETRALMTAAEFTAKYKGSFKNKVKLFQLRYCFNSVVFHEVFASMRHVQPTYRVSRVVALQVLTTVIATATSNGQFTFQEYATLGVVAGVVFFLSAHGEAFFAHRALVAKVTAKGNPLSFA